MVVKTKQEEIRKEIEKFVSEAYWYEGHENKVVDITARLVNYLASQGVVLKVDKEWPHLMPEVPNSKYSEGYSEGERNLLSLFKKIGYTTFESLIKE